MAVANGTVAASVSSQHSVWNLVKKHLDFMVDDALKGSNDDKEFEPSQLKELQKRIWGFLNKSLRYVGLQPHNSTDRTVRHEVENAVSQAFQDMNITDTNATLSNTIVKKLDQEIELHALGKLLGNVTGTTEGGDFFHNMPVKDETMFVALVCMGIVLPIIIITLSALYFYRRKQENIQRQNEMLLKEPEFCMDEYTQEGDGTSTKRESTARDEDVPDLDLKHFRT